MVIESREISSDKSKLASKIYIHPSKVEITNFSSNKYTPVQISPCRVILPKNS